MIAQGKHCLKAGWRALLQNQKEDAQTHFRKAHNSLQRKIILHSITHLSLACTYKDRPKFMLKELYLGFMAPYGTIMLRRKSRKKEKKVEENKKEAM